MLGDGFAHNWAIFVDEKTFFCTTTWQTPNLRQIFIHGVRAVVLRAKREGSYLGQWMKRLEGRAARNRFPKVCRRTPGTKKQSNGVPENCGVTRVFHDRRD